MKAAQAVRAESLGPPVLAEHILVTQENRGLPDTLGIPEILVNLDFLDFQG